ncbi:MAG: hypothetical protein RLZZ553_841 [Verrucomicrobiota bacterium]|jgi:hypothetical protein
MACELLIYRVSLIRQILMIRNTKSCLQCVSAGIGSKTRESKGILRPAFISKSEAPRFTFSKSEIVFVRISRNPEGRG